MFTGLKCVLNEASYLSLPGAILCDLSARRAMHLIDGHIYLVSEKSQLRHWQFSEFSTTSMRLWLFNRSLIGKAKVAMLSHVIRFKMSVESRKLSVATWSNIMRFKSTQKDAFDRRSNTRCSRKSQLPTCDNFFGIFDNIHAIMIVFNAH